MTLEAHATNFAEAWRRLDETIRDAEDWLIETNVSGVEAQVQLDATDYLALRLRFKGKEQRLVCGTAGRENERPLIDASRRRKALALMALDRLVEELQASSSTLLVEVESAIRHAHTVMGKLNA